MSTIIDQDKSSIFIVVQPINSQNTAIITENSGNNKYQANMPKDILINFTPPLPIPAGSVYRFIFADEFSLSSVDCIPFIFTIKTSFKLFIMLKKHRNALLIFKYQPFAKERIRSSLYSHQLSLLHQLPTESKAN